MQPPLALIIEDDEDISVIFSNAVQEAGFQTEVVHGGDTALIRIEEIVPDLIVLDLHLAGIDGKEVLRQIRADSRLDHTRVFVASADAALAQSLKPDLVLVKPVSCNQLRDLSKRFLKKLRMEEN